jgi:hypothetical protein
VKALSFHQPRAEQIIRGLKTVDVRTWQVSYRGPLVVHASSERRNGRCRALGFDPAALAYGALIGMVELTDIVPLDEAAYEALRDEHLSEAPFPGAPCYAWRFANPRRFDSPVSCRGRMRLFEVDVEPARSNDFSRPGAAKAATTRVLYRVTPPPPPDPEHPFVLYAIPEADGGYRVALYQWVRKVPGTSESARHLERVPGAFWSIELGGDQLRAVADHLLNALRANGHKATDLARAAGTDKPFYLDELTGLRLALILMAVKPLTRHDRIEAISQGVQAMSAEEAYYWFSKCSAGPDALRAQKALRILLAGE